MFIRSVFALLIVGSIFTSVAIAQGGSKEVALTNTYKDAQLKVGLFIAFDSPIDAFPTNK